MGWKEKRKTSKLIEFDSDILRRIPLFGRTAAGSPMMAIENPGEYVVIDIRINKVNGNSIEEYFVLEVAGQSMEPTVHDGEIVLVKKQPI
jgi:repressor LexA